ncbi:MAG: Hpt domain-containing protein [Spirochaetes bacterium]|nr:Hpt domain-containing protein [Spirochaetota bacterium]
MEQNNNSNKIQNLPELDIEKGIKRWYDFDSYLEALIMFVEQYGKISEKLVDLIEQKKIEEAALLTHSLKGVFGHLEMHNLHYITKKFNESLKQGDLSNIKETTRTFSSSLKSAIHSINLLKKT